MISSNFSTISIAWPFMEPAVIGDFLGYACLGQCHSYLL